MTTLRQAAQAAIARWDAPMGSDLPDIGNCMGDLRTVLEAHEQEPKVIAQPAPNEPVEWQARTGASWRRIDPTRSETLAQRVAYLQTLKSANGQPAYEIRSLYAQAQPVQPAQPAPDIKALQAKGKGPAPCARFCEANAFETEIRNMELERDEYRAAADKMAAGHKVERDALIAAGKRALDMCVEFSRAPMTQVEYLNLLRTISTLKKAGVTA